MRAWLLVVILFMGCSEMDSSNRDLSSGLAEEKSLANAQKDYDQALQLAQEQNRSVFILMETEHCRWCQRLKSTTLQDQVIAQRLSSEFVVLVLNRDRSHYPETLRTQGVPTVYMTNSEGQVHAKVVGYREDPQEYLKWFDYIAIERGM